jgi:hypothetical protein
MILAAVILRLRSARSGGRSRELLAADRLIQPEQFGSHRRNSAGRAESDKGSAGSGFESLAAHKPPKFRGFRHFGPSGTTTLRPLFGTELKCSGGRRGDHLSAEVHVLSDRWSGVVEMARDLSRAQPCVVEAGGDGLAERVRADPLEAGPVERAPEVAGRVRAVADVSERSRTCPSGLGKAVADCATAPARRRASSSITASGSAITRHPAAVFGRSWTTRPNRLVRMTVELTSSSHVVL